MPRRRRPEGGTVGSAADEGHRYTIRSEWSGSTAEGYEAYERAHDVTAPPVRAAVRVSSEPHFLDDSSLLNPEQLVVTAASSCQLVSFLAVAARVRLDVVAYEDEAEGVMPKATQLGEPMLDHGVVLRPAFPSLFGRPTV